jgi:AAA domain
MTIAGAVADAGLTLAHARWAVDENAAAASKVAECWSRSEPRDEVQTCWLKVVDSRSERWAERAEGFAGLVKPSHDGGQVVDGGQRPSLADRLLSRSALRDLPKPEPLIANVLDRGTTALLYGYWGTGKTFIGLDWGASVATGRDWQGRDTGRLRVLYVAAEGAFGIAQRLDAWETAWRNDIDDEALTVLPEPVNLTDPRDLAALVEVVREGGYGLVIIDTAARCMVGADENSARDIGLVVDALNRLRAATPEGRGVALAIHHTGKDGKTLRGSSAFEAGVDTVYQVTEDGGVIVLDRTKRKDGPKDDRHELRLSAWPGTDSCVVEAASHAGVPSDLSGNSESVLAAFNVTFGETGASKAELRDLAMDKLGLSRSSAYHAINDLLKLGRLRNARSEANPFLVLS